MASRLGIAGATSTLALLLGILRRTRVVLVEVIGLDGDDVVVIGKFACLGGEAQVGYRGHFEARDVEAFCPLVLSFVL